MAKHCRTFEHTADVGLEARAETLGEMFEAMGEGLSGVICPRSEVKRQKKLQIRAEAENVESLLVDFLSEILRLFNLEKFLVAGVSVERIDETAVAAEVVGEPYDPSRHELAEEIKAVTYHQLKVAREGNRWVGRVILDV
ncbi:MAG: archease [Planctomycetota bacterium]|nr:archease [Planctomycetota bacterium]